MRAVWRVRPVFTVWGPVWRVFAQYYCAQALALAFGDMEREKVGPRVRQQCRTLAISALELALQYRMIAFNPARAIKRPRLQPKAIQVFMANEADRFLKAARSHRLYGLFATAIMSGARMGELLALKQGDYDKNTGILNIKYSLRNDAGKLIIVEPKTLRSKRRIALPSEGVEALRIHRETLMAEGLRASKWLFPNGHGELLRKEFVLRAFRQVLKVARLPTLRFHDLRHSHASALLASGADVQAVSARLGHANVSMTLDVYAHLMPAQEERSMAILERLYASKETAG